jgi:hypothetical protein
MLACPRTLAQIDVRCPLMIRSTTPATTCWEPLTCWKRAGGREYPRVFGVLIEAARENRR